MKNVVVEEIKWQPIEEMEVELVERKGLGHPDFIADSAAEEASKALCRYYVNNFGYILHHNLDKVLLVGGQANPVFGGGEVLHPIYIIVSGRATTEVVKDGKIIHVPVGTLIIEAVKNWIRRNFRFLDPENYVIVDYKIGKGSVDLTSVFELYRKYKVPRANDTSFGVSYAPLSTLERIVYSVERYINSPQLKKVLPEVGEDIKVMGLRRGKTIELTIAAAMISKLIPDPDHYFSVKEELKNKVHDYICKLASDYDIKIYINTADSAEHGIYYITVTGTSAEHGDDGATGRGNRVNGLITPMRPMSLEATAGKNPVSHVGKIYNALAKIIAEKIYREVRNVREVYVELLSQIGRPINDPLMANVKVIPETPPLTMNMVSEIRSIVHEELDNVTRLTDKILKGELSIF